MRGCISYASEDSLCSSYDDVVLDFRSVFSSICGTFLWMLVVESALALMLAVRRMIVEVNL